MARGSGVAFFLVFLACLLCAEPESKGMAYYPEGSWRTSPAGKQGMNGAYLNKMHDSFDQRGQIIVIRNGFLIESKASLKLNAMEHIHSCTKSVISLLYGMINTPESVKTRILEFFPEYARTDNQEVTVCHLLSMTSGMDWSDNPNIDSRQLPFEANWVRYILAKKITQTPGSLWNYNSGGSQLLSVILQKQLSRPLRIYVEEKLFKPLGITDYTWWDSNDGYLTAGWGLHLRVFDITKIGYLMLSDGKWNGRRVVSEQWIGEATSRKIKVNADYSYGYQWWIYDSLPCYAYKAYGSYGKHAVMIIVAPEYDLEVVLVGDFRNDVELLRDYILPSIQSVR